jgi:hypothetical protein
MILNIHSDTSYLRKWKLKAEQEDSSIWASALTNQQTRQWCNFNHQHDSQTRHVISGKIKNWSSVHQFKRRNSTPYNIRRTGTSSASNTIVNTQHNINRLPQWENKTKTHKSYGHVFLLSDRQSQTRPVSCILGPRIPTFSRLFHEVPFSGTS